MHPAAEPLMMELQTEGQTTRRVLERVPQDKFTWRPHGRSFSMGELALHTAQVPAALGRLLTDDVFLVTPFTQAEAKTSAEVLQAHDDSMIFAQDFLKGLTVERANTIWKLRAGDKDVMAAPRLNLVRALMFNHWYHHRGQLLVYLRLLDIPVPSVYGPTADENPFLAN
ncbi:MAG TPA: DinB family protein [Gemmatimonadales bacterium]|jgi:uncharacterized damage-inducible protein DinB|nr:DinB family protein [Gemmatimonadales bacterium]